MRSYETRHCSVRKDKPSVHGQRNRVKSATDDKRVEGVEAKRQLHLSRHNHPMSVEPSHDGQYESHELLIHRKHKCRVEHGL